MYALQQSCAILVKGLALDLYSMARLIQNQEPFKLGTYLTFVQFDNTLYELEVT